MYHPISLFNSEIDYVRLANLSYEGMLDINDDGINVRVGGIVGKFPMIQSGNSKIEFSDVRVKGDSDNKIVSYSGETKSSATSSSIGGICGMCLSSREISKSSVEGDFRGSSGDEASPKKAFHVGGLVGTAVVAEGPMVIKNNYFIGSIENKFNKDEGAGRAGYLFGYVSGEGLGNHPQFISNFHYGDDNVGTIGYFSNYGDYQNVLYFNEDGFNKLVAKHNVRDGSAMNLQNGENGSSMNGTVTESYMKSELFAGFLNSPWEDDEQVWSFDDTHEFPYFGTTPVPPMVQVVFRDAAGDKTRDVKIGGAAVVPEDVKLMSEGKCLTGWNPADFTNVAAPMTITAVYGECPSSSSSEATSSSSVAASSSSTVAASSSSSEKATGIMTVAMNDVKFGFANNMLTVAMPNSAMLRVQVFDMTGHLVESFAEPVVSSKSFSLTHLNKGSYLVRVESNRAVRTARILVR